MENNNTGNWNTGNLNTGDRNTGNWNTGNLNTGNLNTGNLNTGDRNTGDLNTGNWNTGNLNTGNLNTGDRNTGDLNTGDRNTGDRNTGDWNTGDRNTGDLNTGDRNTGDRNTGDWNTGNWNTGNLNTGDLNTTEPKLRLFNFETDWKFRGHLHMKLKKIIYKYQKPLCEWISKSNMTDEEIKENPTCETTGGYLKVNKNMRNNIEIAKEDREFLLSVPNFDNSILKECTGIDLENEKVKIIIDKKEIWISKESANELKKSLID